MQNLYTIPLRILLIGVLLSALTVSFAFRSVSLSSGITYATGDGFNLKIDSRAFYNGAAVPASTWNLKNLTPGSDKFFNLSDVKPGDRGETTISFHVNKTAWICLDFEKLKQKENGRNEPESHEDPSGGSSQGELAAGTEFFAWLDDGDNTFEIGELPLFGTTTQSATQVFNNKTYAIADSLAGYPLVASTTKYVGITWCAGNLGVNLASAVISCDGSALGNAAQTDSFSVDIGIRAVPTKGNKNFTCIKKGNNCEWPGNVKVTINNNGDVTNTTTANSNTGGNNAGSGGTVNTGNASSTSSTTNIINRIRLLIGR